MAAHDNITTKPIHHWPSEASELYLRDADRIEALNGPFGEAMLDAAALKSGERVLDVGCGCGTTAVEAARRVRPGGTVVGVDVTAALLDRARREASACGVDTIDLVEADAQTHTFAEGAFDVVISRFGIMFFDNPTSAFTNLGRAVRTGGRLAIVCPADPLHSEWIAIAFTAAAAHVGVPNLGPPGAPGPFAFADEQRLERTIVSGGFHHVTVEAITRAVRIGDNVDDVAAFITSLPEGRQLLAGRPDQTVRAVLGALKSGFAPHATADGVIVHETAWLATARR